MLRCLNVCMAPYTGGLQITLQLERAPRGGEVRSLVQDPKVAATLPDSGATPGAEISN